MSGLINSLAYEINLINLTVTLTLSLVCIIYLFGIQKLVDGRFAKIWRLFLAAFIIFAFDKLIRILDGLSLINSTSYRGVISAVFIILLTIGLVKLNTHIRNVINEKNSHKRRR